MTTGLINVNCDNYLFSTTIGQFGLYTWYLLKCCIYCSADHVRMFRVTKFSCVNFLCSYKWTYGMTNCRSTIIVRGIFNWLEIKIVKHGGVWNWLYSRINLSGCFNETSRIGNILVAVFGTSLARVIACEGRCRGLSVTRSTCHEINSHEINFVLWDKNIMGPSPKSFDHVDLLN